MVYILRIYHDMIQTVYVQIEANHSKMAMNV